MNLTNIIKKLTQSTGVLTILPCFALFTALSCQRQSDYSNANITTIELADTPNIEIDTVEEPEVPQITVNSEKSEELMDFMRNTGNWDNYREGILPSMLEKSPKYVKKLLNNSFSGFIAVDKSRMKVILFDRYGVAQKTYGMACAKNFGTKHEKGDSRTPEGFFSVEGIYDSTEWLFTDDNGVTSKKKGQFGPRFIRLRIPGTSQIGIHGTCAPWSIGSRASHGCIRIKNENILELVELVEIGMPVIIVPGRKDIIRNMIEGVDIPWVPTSKSAKEPKIKPEEVKVPELPADTICIKDSIQTPIMDTDSVKISEPTSEPDDEISIEISTLKN